MDSPLNDYPCNEQAEQETMDQYKTFIGGQPLSGSAEGINPKDRVGMKKPPLALLPPVAKIHFAMAMKNGAQKYGPYNWRREKIQAMIYLDAALRHIEAFIDGEKNAADSGCHHLAHAGACCAILLDAFEGGHVVDNRPLPGKAAELLKQMTDSSAPATPAPAEPTEPYDYYLDNVGDLFRFPKGSAEGGQYATIGCSWSELKWKLDEVPGAKTVTATAARSHKRFPV